MVNITESELWAFNLLNTSVNNAKGELDRCVAARSAYVELLENKYGAVFNWEKGLLEDKAKGKQGEGV